MQFRMTGQIRLLGESLATMATLEGFDAGVNSSVTIEIRLPGKRFGTQRALEWPFTSVDTNAETKHGVVVNVVVIVVVNVVVVVVNVVVIVIVVYEMSFTTICPSIQLATLTIYERIETGESGEIANNQNIKINMNTEHDQEHEVKRKRK